MTVEYVEEDDIKVLLTDYINWIDTTAIPKFLYGNLERNRNIILNTRTLKNNISKLILTLKEMFP